jgi:hypothetical protein
MATRKRKPGRKGWMPPIGAPLQLPADETRFSYQMFCSYWEGWATAPIDDPKQRDSAGMEAATAWYREHRPAAKTAAFVTRSHRDFSWQQRADGRITDAMVKNAKLPSDVKKDAFAKPPETFPEFVENLLLIGQRSLVLEIAQLQRVQLVIDQVLEARSLDGFEAETTGIRTIDAMIAMLLNAKSAVRGAKK